MIHIKMKMIVLVETHDLLDRAASLFIHSCTQPATYVFTLSQI